MPLTKVQTEMAGTGSVLQVVNAVFTNNTTGVAGAEVYTNYSAAITPKFSSSKILVIFNVAYGSYGGSNEAVSLQIRRGLTTSGTLLNRQRMGAYGISETYLPQCIVSLDSPATTSNTSYGLFASNVDGGATWTINPNSGITTITLMEIAG